MKKLILIIHFSLLVFHFTLAQQYDWMDISSNIPDYPYDTVYYGPDTSLPIFYKIFFIDEQEAWIPSFRNFWDDSAAILHTIDACQTFEVQMVIRPVMALYMLDENTGYCGGASGIINKTTDGGDHWNFFATLGAGTITDIDFPPGSDTGYCCRSPEKVVRILPDGIEDVPTETPVGLNLNSICFPFEDEGWISGEDHILHYLEDTAMFIHDQSIAYGYKADLFFLDGTHKGWCASSDADYEKVFRTTDGMSWQGFPLPESIDDNLQDVFFLDEYTGWSVGMNGVIVKTTDGGSTWVQEAAGLTENHLASVFAVDENHVYAVGAKNTLLMYGELVGMGEDEERREMQVEIYPNPAQSSVKCRVSNVKNEACWIELVALSGKQIIHEIFPPGEKVIELDVSKLPGGIYLCRVMTDKGSAMKKIIIQ